MPNPLPDPDTVILDYWGNEVTPWSAVPNAPTTLADAIRHVGGPRNP
jgi:hypothetical protein